MSKQNGKKKGGCLLPVIVVFVVLGLLSSCFGGSDDSIEYVDLEPETVVQQETVEETQELPEEKEVIEIETNVIEETEPVEEVPVEETEEVVEEMPLVETPVEEEPVAEPPVEEQTTEDYYVQEEYTQPEQSYVEPEPPIVPPVNTQSQIVYITDTGEKYHYGSCRHLSQSKIEINLDEAIAMGYEPCGTCH